MPDQNRSKRLQRTIVAYSAVGMFVVGVIVGLVGVLPLATRLREAEQRNLLVEVQTRAVAIEQLLSRIKAGALYIGNRTHCRERLEADFRGEAAPDEIATLHERIRRDLAAFSNYVSGMILLDAHTHVVVRVGHDIPPDRWPLTGFTNREPVIQGPFLLDAQHHLAVSAPVQDSLGSRIGTALILYHTTSLERIVEDFKRLGRTGKAILGDVRNKELPIFFQPRLTQGNPLSESGRITIQRALATAAQGRADVLDSALALDPSVVLAYGPIKGTSWGMVVSKQRWELFSTTNRQLTLIGTALAILILLGTGGMVLVLRPLAGRVILHTDELESQIYEKTAALNTELAERKRAEDSLRDSEALYHSLVDTLPIFVLRKDLKGRITFGNKSYCEMLGQPLEALLGHTDRELFPPELADKYVRDDDKVVTTGEVFEDVEEHSKPDGTRLHVHVIKAPVHDAKGSIVGTQIIFWDETARKQAETERQRAAAELARSVRELEQFAYVASHDLQEPLRMIANYTQLLAQRYQGRLDADADEFIGYAVEGAARMQTLITDLLTYSRISIHGKSLATTDCSAALQRACENLKPEIEHSRAVIRVGPLPQVVADSVQLTQLFQNLLSNALKFRSEAIPEIQVDAAPMPASTTDASETFPLAQWQFSVRDNGIGIEREYFDRIFVIFQRLHARNRYTGTGMGLAVCKKIVERHGGRIWVESELGQGSTVSFTFPRPETVSS